jgi:Mg-chelatase subunit ChlD
MLQNADRDGIELSFTTSSNARQTNDIDQLYQHACKEPQKGTSDMEEALQKAVNKHTFRMERESNPRPLSIYILTDGRFGGNPEVVLLGLEQMLRDRRLPRTSLGVQFISFGSDEEGLGKMQLLDDMSDKGKFDLPL